MDLIFPDEATDVPDRYEMHARLGDDVWSFAFQTRSLAQVVIPTEDSLGVTVINELHGTYEVEGVIDGERARFRGAGFFEFLSA
ncbi:MAG: hypothetical protein R3B82_22315 [Sandaracinaceae bacterium]